MGNSTFKQRLAAFWEWLVTTLGELWQEFRSRSIYYQAKAWVLAIYGAIVVVTVLWAPPPKQNDIEAKILLANDFLLGPYIMVENKSDEPWTKVRYTLNEQYTLRGTRFEKVEPKQRIHLHLNKFGREELRTLKVRQKGTQPKAKQRKKRKKKKRRPKATFKTVEKKMWVAFPDDRPLQKLDIIAEEGEASFDLTKMKMQQNQ